jgi:hypothetical protein
LKLGCRKARKAESQRRWLAKPSNQDYFRGSSNVERVRQWRKQNPRYWERRRKPFRTLQDLVASQAIEHKTIAATASQTPLQDLLAAQDPLVLGLISQLIDSALQDQLEKTTLSLLSRGRSILETRSRTRQKQPKATSAESVSSIRVGAGNGDVDSAKPDGQSEPRSRNEK